MNKEERNYLSEENFGEAVSRFKRSLLLGRKSYFDVSEFEGIVESLLDEGDINTSEIAARQGMQIHPGAVPLQLKYAQVLLSKGKYKTALKYIGLAEKVEADNPDVHLMKGSAWLMTGEDKEAENAFSKAVRHAGSEKDDILYHIGSSYVQAGEIQKAIGYFEKSLAVNPENEMALYDLGFFSDQEGEYQKSIDYYNQYLDIDPFNFSIWFNLGISHNKAGNFEQAIEAYEYALTLNEEFHQALFNIGNAYANAGNFNQAIDRYLRYVELDPENDEAWSYIGECYLNLEDHTKAEYYYRKAIRLNKENDAAWFGIGLIMWLDKKWAESIVYIKKALAVDNLNSEYWITLAKVYNDYNRPKKAEDALIKAAELEAENTEVWLTWVDIFMKFGELENALRVLKSGLEKNNDSLLKFRMVSLLLESNREKEALHMLETAMEQEFNQINYLFDVYPKALKNKKLQKFVKEFRERNNL